MPAKTKKTKKKTVQEPWHVLRRSSIHNRGVFAAREIPRGQRVVEYVGERINKTEGKRRADALLAKSKKTGGAAVYIFDMNSRWDLDGDIPGNDAKYINHSCEPNCQVYDVRGRLFITAKRRLYAGEELTYNYGFDLEHWEEHPCRCGSPHCVGYIVDRKYWKKLAADIQKKASAKNGHKLNGKEPHYDPLHAQHKRGAVVTKKKKKKAA
jgi:uncharacterized protein